MPVPVTGDGPKPTAYPSVAYASQRDALLAFGGWAKDAEQPSAELWMLELGEEPPFSWRLLSDGKQGPRGRNGACMVFDKEGDRLVLHGGDGGSHPQMGFTPLDDLWSYDLGTATWRQLTPTGEVPTPRWNHSSALNGDGDRMYVFGGAGYVDSRILLDQDLYALDLRSIKWTRMPTGTFSPAPVEGATLTFDQAANVLLLVGGISIQNVGNPGYRIVFCYHPNAGRWTEHAGKLPTTRTGHVAAYCPETHQHVVFGGETAEARGNFYARGRTLEGTLLIEVAKHHD